jgi:hypothetical protein
VTVQEYVLRMAPPEERQQRRYLGSFPLVGSDPDHCAACMRQHMMRQAAMAPGDQHSVPLHHAP